MKVKEFLKQSFHNLLYQLDQKQNTRCKINTGFVCNQACSFCYFYSKRDVCNLSLDCIKKQLAIAKKLGVESVDFSGGEPTIHPQFCSALKYAKDLEFKNICCITNGSKIANHNILELFKNHGLNDVLISIHGIEKLHNDIVKTKNSWKLALHALYNCKNSHITTRVNTVVTRYNYKDLTALAKILKRESPYQWNIIIYKMQYECGDPDKDNFISHFQSAPRIKEAIDIALESIPYVNVRYMPFCFMQGYEQHITNYPQKIYDSYEWSNYLLQMFEKCEDDIMNLNIDPTLLDLQYKNNFNVGEIRQYQYTKPDACIGCSNYLICDGFENKYLEREEINVLKKPIGNLIKDPLYYRREYYDI